MSAVAAAGHRNAISLSQIFPHIATPAVLAKPNLLHWGGGTVNADPGESPFTQQPAVSEEAG